MSNIASPMPQLRAKFTNKLGLPLSGGKVYTYEPGTNIPKKTWRDVDKLVENTNPIQLDAAGEADIYGMGFYRVVVKDFFGLTIYDVEKTGIAVDLDASFVVDGSQTQKEINLYGGKKYDMSVIYQVGQVAILHNGDAVRATIPGVNWNPDIDMTGWELVKDIINVPDISGLVSLPPGHVSSRYKYQVWGFRGGGFFYTTSNIAAKVKSDPAGGMYIPYPAGSNGTEGGFIRHYDGGSLKAVWFGVQTIAGFDNTSAIRGAIVAAAAELPPTGERNPSIEFPAGRIEFYQNNLLGEIDFLSYGLTSSYIAGIKLQGQGITATLFIAKPNGAQMWLYDSLTNQKQTMYDVHFVDMGIRADDAADLENFNLFKIYSTGTDKRFRFWRCGLRGAQILSLHGTGNADLHRFEGCSVHAYKSFLELNNNQSVATETYSTDFHLLRDFIVLGENGGGSFKQFGGNLEMHAHPTDTTDHYLFKDIGNADNKMGLGNCDFLSSGVRYEIHGANKKLFKVDRTAAARPIIYTYDNAQFGTVAGGSRQAVLAKGLNLVVNFKNSTLHDDFTFYGESASAMTGGANAPVGVMIKFRDCCAGRSLNLAPRCTLSGNKVRYISDGTYKMAAAIGARASLDDFDFGWQSGVCSRSAAVKVVSLTSGQSTNGLGNTQINLAFPSGAYIKRLSIKAPAGTGTTPYKIHIGHKETNTIIASSAGTTIADAHDILVEDVGIFNFDLLSMWAVTDGGSYKLITATMDYI